MVLYRESYLYFDWTKVGDLKMSRTVEKVNSVTLVKIVEIVDAEDLKTRPIEVNLMKMMYH